MLGARIRLASLWVSQVARVLADWCLRVLAFLECAGPGLRNRGSAWHLATAVFIAPFILLAPLTGCLSNGLSRRLVLGVSAAFTLATVACCAALGAPWLVCLAVAALGAAAYSPSRYAILPAASVDTGLPLPLVSGWIEMGGAAAIVGGIALGWSLPPPDWAGSGTPLGGPVVAVLLALNLLSFVTALPVAFPSDVPRPESPARAAAGFFRDCGRIARVPGALNSLLSLAAFQAVVTAGSGALLAQALSPDRDPGGLVWALTAVGVGAALGCLVAGLQPHRCRNLGFVSWGSAGLLLGLGWAAWASAAGNRLPLAPCFLLGFTGGLVNVPLRSAYLAALPANARGNGTAVMNTAIYSLTTLLALVLVALAWTGLLTTPVAQLELLAILTAAGSALAWWQLRSQTAEQVLEWLVVPMYRTRAHGPGRDRVPARGPLLLVANHSAYLDPFWLYQVMPRHLTPMMTSVFYDLPVLRWFLRHVIGAIRVPAASFRREAPELRDAVAALHRGACVLIFPEAILRRRADQLLRPFGQGIWHILQELPDTPVVVCWIEGGWGSFTSYFKGPPFKNKRPDWRRPINIGMAEPRVLPPEVLADQRATRAWLMRACLDCRRYLGLEVPPAPGEEKEEVERPAEKEKVPKVDPQPSGRVHGGGE